MYLTKRLTNSVDIVIAAFQEVETRLKETCFRGVHDNLAGNFCCFNSLKQVFANECVKNVFLQEVKPLYSAHNQNCQRLERWLTIVLPKHVGWESTAPFGNFHPNDLEQFSPNNKSTALRVKTTRPDLVAPLTNSVTIIFDLQFYSSKRSVSRVVAHIWSMYPGVYIGDLNGDITQREQRVFFDWNHPGESRSRQQRA